jgi:anti-sigma-K factor RskA
MMVDDHLLAGAYALGSLDPSEATAFEAHLMECPDCRNEVAELTDTAAALALAVPAPVSDPLFERVMAQVRTTPQLPALRPPDEPSAPAGGRVIPLRRPARPGRWLLGAAAALALVLVAATMVTRLAGERARDDELAAIVDDPASQLTRLQGDGPGDVDVYVQAASGKAAVETRGLPGLDPARTYELWFLTGATPHRAVTFTPDSSGTTRVAFPMPVAAPEAFAVTVEPAGGSDAPTLPLVHHAPA